MWFLPGLGLAVKDDLWSSHAYAEVTHKKCPEKYIITGKVAQH